MLLLALLLAAPPALQATLPNDGWVTDRAGILTPEQERGLEALMESYKQGSTHEIAVLTVAELGGQSIERLALETARAWGIGTKDTNNGALLVVAVKDRKLRIEVGRGLEGTLTDSIAGRIIRDVIAPEFKRGDYYAGIHAGVIAMHQAAGGEYAAVRRSRGGRSSGGAIVGCFSTLFFVFLLVTILAQRGRGGGIGNLLTWLLLAQMSSGSRGWSGGGRSGGGFGGGGGFSGFGGGGGFSGGGASGGW